MRRPLYVVGFTLLVSLYILCALNSIAVALMAGLISYILFMVSCFINETRYNLTLPTAFFTVVLACFMFYMAQGNYNNLASLAGTDSTVVCRVQEKPVFNEIYGRYYCKARVIKIDGESYRGSIRLSFNTTYDDLEIESFEIGNKLSFKGHLYNVGGENEGIIDYFKSENIYIGAYGLKDMSVLLPDKRPLSYYGDKLRNFIAESLRNNYSLETTSLLVAILTGNKDYISDEAYNAFKNSGVAHILAVSGMHLSVMVLLIDLLLRRLRKKFKVLYFVIMCMFVLLIMFVAAFSSSVVRAGVMMLLVLTGRLIDKRADSLNSLGFACICILIQNPFSAMSVGFLLSVISVWSIVVAAVPFCKRHRYYLADRLSFSSNVSFTVTSAILFSVVVSFCVLVCTFPIMTTYFGQVSLISPVTNLLFLPVTTPIIYLALISAVLCGFDIMPSLLVYITEKLSDYCLWAADILGGTDRFVLKTQGALSGVLCWFVPVLCYAAIKMISYLYKMYKRNIKPR